MAEAGEFFEQFIDDYFAECDEHLATFRRILLAIDSDPSAGRSQFHELARVLHTLKGLSGMVGLTSAEQVAHAMEEALAGLSSDGASPQLVELLFTGERLLESAIESRRLRKEPVSTVAYMDEVHRLVAERGDLSHHGTTTVASPRAEPAGTAVAIPKQRTTYRFEFVPGADLTRRGVGVEVIRQRLKSIGDITSTSPRVNGSGGVVFEFVVSMPEGVEPDDEWLQDGLTWTRDGELSLRPLAAMRSDAERPSGAPIASTANVVRVDLARLDDLMRLVGELVVARSRLGESLSRIEDQVSDAAWDDVSEATERLERQLRTIREGVMRIRLVPVGEVFERMRFAMREISREAGKEIRLELSGQDTELDKLVVDRMVEPLLHLVRNAASHGIESSAERSARGKPAWGLLHLRARTAGDRVVLEIEDDGAGIDVSRVARRAAAAGLIPEHAELLPDGLLDVICTPGFSTREAADMASGRGVGMAVVRTTIRALGGELFVHTFSGRGTRFTIELPLTLMITDALVVEIGDQAMAIPQIVLREIIPLDPAAVTRFESNEVISHRGRVIPLVNLGRFFAMPPRANAKPHVLIVGGESHQVGLIVDRLVGLREIVVHPISDPLVAVPGVSGATELADGRVSLILDAAALIRSARESRASQHRSILLPRESAAAQLGGESIWS